MAEGDLHSYVCDDSSQESASDSEDFLEGKLIWAYVVLGQNWGTPEIIVLSKLWYDEGTSTVKSSGNCPVVENSSSVVF